MAASQDRNRNNSVDVDPEASLAIRLYLREGSRMLPDPQSDADGNHAHPRTLDQRDPDTHGQFGNLSRKPNPMTLDDVLSMTFEQLDGFQDRVGQMEISNYGLLTRIYGRFPLGRKPFPLVITSRWTSSTFPESGSSQHRQLVFKQYQKMMEIAHDPTHCVDIIEPATAKGAKALQEYQMQLALLAEHKRAHMKRKHQVQDNAPRRPQPPPRFDSGSLRAMQEQCRVLDLEPQPNLRMDHRNDRVIPTVAALTEYQQQLLLLEEQNKKRLLLARQEKESSARAQSREHDGTQMRQKPGSDDRPSLPIRRRRTYVD